MIDKHYLIGGTFEFGLGPTNETICTGLSFIYSTFSTKVEKELLKVNFDSKKQYPRKVKIPIIFFEVALTSNKNTSCPGQVAQLVGASSHTPKGWGFGPH